MAILSASRRTSPIAFARTHEDRTLPADAAAGGGPQFRDQPRDAGKQIPRDGRRGHLECDITAVADDLRADFDKFLLPGIAENERVAGFIDIGHADDPRE